MSNQTLAERIDILYEARLRNPNSPEAEIEVVNKHGVWALSVLITDALNPRFKVRLKPKTVTREITYPEPLRDAPEHGAGGGEG